MKTDIHLEYQDLKIYAKQLQRQNKARDDQRKKLQEQVQRLSNSRKQDLIYITTLTTSCQKYKAQILQLKNKIKHLQQSEYIHIDKNKKTYTENDVQLKKLQQQNLKLIQHNKVLIEKNCFLEDRVLKTQNANKTLRQQILNKINENNKKVKINNFVLQNNAQIQQYDYLSPIKVKMCQNQIKIKYYSSSSMLKQEHWQNLQRKIHILDRQNNQLRYRLQNN